MTYSPEQWAEIQDAIYIAAQTGFFAGAVFGLLLWLFLGSFAGGSKAPGGHL